MKVVVFCHKISNNLEFLVTFQNVVVLWDGYVKCGSFLSITLRRQKTNSLMEHDRK